MKRFTMIMICLLAMMTASQDIKAQEVTIYLYPGYTWISYPRTDTLDFTTALNSFTPMAGDIIKSQWGNASYINGQWRGSISKFYPGYGYMYKSTRMVPVPLTFTIAHKPEVSTLEAINITATTATVGGNILDDGSATITQCGVCWSTEPNPTINDSIIIAEGVTNGEFTMELTGLTIYAIYYVRAFATNSIGTTYDDEVSFKALPEGAIKGLFSVSETQQVWFSQGNLQYQASTNTWHFADNQWDYVGSQTPDDYGNFGGTINGSDNNDISSTYEGWIDLFCWGTSGYNHGANCYQPWSTSQTNTDFYAYGSYTFNLNAQTGKADWGYNPISNGGNTANQWRTLTQPEWNYIFNTRITPSGIRFAKAKVNDVNGVVLLPDDWNSNTYILNNANNIESNYSNNIISITQWAILEQSGVVFLPAAGGRLGTYVFHIGSDGHYWSATYYDSICAYLLRYSNSSLHADNYFDGRDCGFAVRLVKDCNP